MKANLISLLALGLVALPGPAAGETRGAPERTTIAAADIERCYRAARPTAAELALYRLDWVADVKTALARGVREHRPVLALIIRNISGGGNIYSGHC